MCNSAKAAQAQGQMIEGLIEKIKTMAEAELRWVGHWPATAE